MLELKLKPEAEKDLERIFEYTTFKWNLAQAEKYQDELFGAMKLIVQNQYLGKTYNSGTNTYRKLHINRHLIFYRVKEKSCIVVRILHDSMDIKSHLDTQA